MLNKMAPSSQKSSTQCINNKSSRASSSSQSYSNNNKLNAKQSQKSIEDTTDSDYERLLNLCNSYGLNQQQTEQLLSQFRKGQQNMSFRSNVSQDNSMMSVSQHEEQLVSKSNLRTKGNFLNQDHQKLSMIDQSFMQGQMSGRINDNLIKNYNKNENNKNIQDNFIDQHGQLYSYKEQSNLTSKEQYQQHQQLDQCQQQPQEKQNEMTFNYNLHDHYGMNNEHHASNNQQINQSNHTYSNNNSNFTSQECEQSFDQHQVLNMQYKNKNMNFKDNILSNHRMNQMPIKNNEKIPSKLLQKPLQPNKIQEAPCDYSFNKNKDYQLFQSILQKKQQEIHILQQSLYLQKQKSSQLEISTKSFLAKIQNLQKQKQNLMKQNNSNKNIESNFYSNQIIKGLKDSILQLTSIIKQKDQQNRNLQNKIIQLYQRKQKQRSQSSLYQSHQNKSYSKNQEVTYENNFEKLNNGKETISNSLVNNIMQRVDSHKIIKNNEEDSIKNSKAINRSQILSSSQSNKNLPLKRQASKSSIKTNQNSHYPPNQRKQDRTPLGMKDIYANIQIKDPKQLAKSQKEMISQKIMKNNLLTYNQKDVNGYNKRQSLTKQIPVEQKQNYYVENGKQNTNIQVQNNLLGKKRQNSRVDIRKYKGMIEQLRNSYTINGNNYR